MVKRETSDQRRYLFRLNVEQGTGGNAAVPGDMVGGKTGTAEKVENGKYSATKNVNSFLAAFPIDDPQYVVLIVLDDPQAEKPGGRARRRPTTPPIVAGAIMRRLPRLLGVEPRAEEDAAALLASN